MKTLKEEDYTFSTAVFVQGDSITGDMIENNIFFLKLNLICEDDSYSSTVILVNVKLKI